MRRKLQQVTEETIIDSILQKAQVCRLGLCHDGEPYVVPVSYGVIGRRLYAHGASSGKKINLLRDNPRVCVEMELETVQELKQKGTTPCEWGMQYASLIGMGRGRIVEDETEKRAALDAIIRHYGGEPPEYSPDSIRSIAVIEIEIEELTCKTSTAFPLELLAHQ